MKADMVQIKEIEQFLEDFLSSDVGIISDLGRYVCSGGKRFRPTLTVLLYQLFGGKSAKELVIELAAALEIIHLATLAHDDVIDFSDRRRDRPTLQEIWGNRIAVLEGDFMFSRILKILNRYDFTTRQLIIDTLESIVTSELLQESLRWSIPTPKLYFQVIEGKTGSLIATCCELGAILGDPDLKRSKLVEVSKAGLLIGTAYQMIDDFLDIFGNSIGKPTWKDRDGGWITLPFIMLLERAGGKEKERIRGLLKMRELLDSEKEYLLDKLVEYGVKEDFLKEARRRLESAKASLDKLVDFQSEYGNHLYQTMEFVWKRKR
jgi:octaprenyl-diphosphate synthase